jgi:gliding motility-associated-like protein
VPNAFSPNNDGLNDVFKVNKNNDYAISQFEVFDRWGNSIFLSTSNTPYWDGTYMGQPSDIGTYFYIVRANCIGGKMDEIVLKGTVSLVR